MYKSLILAVLVAGPTWADILIPVRTIRAQQIVTSADFRVEAVNVQGSWPVDLAVDGLETRVALYAGRPVRQGDLGPPALVERNDIITLVFAQGGLKISAEGRALSRGGIGDTVRIMNLASRTTITGTVRENGTVEVR